MTSVATVVRGQIRRNRQRDPAIRRRVTAIATLLRSSFALHVLSMIELHVEAFIESCREVLQRWISALRVCVADQAHRNRGCCELSAMTIGAGFVTGKAWRCGVVSAFVTGIACDGTVSLARVQEL